MSNTCRTFSGLVRKESQKEINDRMRFCAEGSALNIMREAMDRCAEMGVSIYRDIDDYRARIDRDNLEFEVNLKKYKAYVARRVQNNKENNCEKDICSDEVIE